MRAPVQVIDDAFFDPAQPISKRAAVIAGRHFDQDEPDQFVHRDLMREIERQLIHFYFNIHLHFALMSGNIPG